MSGTFFVILCLLFIFYVYINHNVEISATTSVVYQSWSRNCRARCGRGEYSGLRGPSGLRGSIGSRYPNNTIAQSGPEDSPCECETCACALIEDVLRTCRPATDLYSQLIRAISNYSYDVIKTFTDLYNYVERVLQTGGIYQRQVEYIPSNQIDAIATLSGKQNKQVSILKTRVGNVREQPKKTIAFSNADEGGTSKDEDNSEASDMPYTVAINLEGFEEIRPEDSIDSLTSTASCSQCVKKGTICMKNCPRAKTKQK